MRLRVGNILERSRANGPGDRYVVWVSGCSLGCKGCYNPDLWEAGGRWIDVQKLATQILAVPGLRGIMVSGGEPLEQAEAVSELLSLVRPNLDALVFTGLTPHEIASRPNRSEILNQADLVIAGRYAPGAGKTFLVLTGRIGVNEVPGGTMEV